jgi:hypothetical protein
MASKKTTKNTQADTAIVIVEARKGAPENMLGTASIQFRSGLMAGLTLGGIALWKATRADGTRFVSITFPARAVERGEDVTYYDHVRGNGDDLKRLKAAIVVAYRQHAAGKARQPEPQREAAAVAA